MEKKEITMGEDNTVEVLNTFFSVTNNLKIEGYSKCDPPANNISDLF